MSKHTFFAFAVIIRPQQHIFNHTRVQGMTEHAYIKRTRSKRMVDRSIIEGSNLRLRAHCIHIDNRELMSVTGVKDVLNFNEQEVSLVTEAGELHIEGNDLHITKLNLDDGQGVIEGELIALEYADLREAKGGLFSRMFK